MCGLDMATVPQLGDEGGWYVLSRNCLIVTQSRKVCGHERSLCLPIAHTQFKIAGKWWAWIDYKHFQEAEPAI